MSGELQEFVHGKVAEYMRKRNDLKENFVLEYLIKNPELSINDIELVEKRVDDKTIIWFCRAKAGVPVPLKSGLGWAIRHE